MIWIGTEALLANRRYDALASYVSCPFGEYWPFSIPSGRATMHPFELKRQPVIRPLQFIDFGSQHEIALGEAINLMGPNRDLCLAPAEADIGMMPLLFC
jgi:hypothetical protein